VLFRSIKYFIGVLGIDIKFYGKIMDFENYKDNPRYIYYREHIVQDDTFRQKPIIGASKQDYTGAVRLILDNYEYPVTCKTIERWCDLIRSKEFVWDRVNPTEIIPLLVKRLDQPLPLTYDFGEFNSMIFGREWSDRPHLVDYCLSLQQKVEKTEQRCELLEERYHHLQSKYDQLVSFLEDRNNFRGCRIRRETIS